MKLPIAVQVYSVRDCAEDNLLDTLKKIKEFGYDGVEFAGLYGHSIDEVNSMLKETGLTAISAHVPLTDMIADADGIGKTYSELGCKYIAIPYLVAELRPGTEGFSGLRQNIIKIAETFKKYGITLLYHNHDFEFAKIDGKYLLDILYDTVDKEHLQTELDLCWVKVGGEEPENYMKKYVGRSPVVHLKDFNGIRSKEMYELIGIEKKIENSGNFEFRPLGQGVVNTKECVRVAEETGVGWLIVENDTPQPGKTSMQCIKESIDYLKKI